MATVRFTENIQRHVACPTREASGATVADVLASYFDAMADARARDYVLDERGAVRTHMVVFVNGRPVADRATLSDPIDDDATIDVMQALSGG